MNLYVVSQQDENLLKMLTESEGDFLLMQNAVYYINKDNEKNTYVIDAIEKGKKVYALESDVTKRGILEKIIEGVELLNFEKIVDVLFSGYTVLNM